MIMTGVAVSLLVVSYRIIPEVERDDIVVSFMPLQQCACNRRESS